MKPFEELYTAWLDGELSGPALADFERELEKRGEPISEKADFSKFQTFLRANSLAPTLNNPDFFNHGILEQLATARPARAPKTWLGLPRFAWFGGLSMATALVLFLAIIPKKSETHSQSAYIAQVISARSADPHISATAFQTDPLGKDDMTVVWLDGLDYVPAHAQ